MKKLRTIFTIFTVIFLFQFCTKNSDITATTDLGAPNLPSIPFTYNVAFPTHVQTSLAANDNTPANNRITDEGATLGRVLFYDTHLSKNNTISCASCHKQEFSFDDNEILSKGFEGGNTSRNSMMLLNVRFYKSGKMFWDERSASLETQILQPIQNHVEMGLTLNELETKVKSLDYYPNLFLKAFGSNQIDSIHIARAISQYVRSIVTYQSKYDLVKQGKTSFTNAETLGEQIFLNTAGPGGVTCAGCHTPPMFINSNPAAGFGLPDANDLGINGTRRFKSGSLRNIMSHSHLFHNGSIANVQAMLTAGAPGSGTLAIPAHSIAPQDVNNMMAFLNTLTDQTIYTEAKFSNPFVK